MTRARITPISNSYLKLYQSAFFALAVKRPDGQLSHEEVVKQLTELTVAYDTGLSIRGDFAELLHVTFKVEKDTYEQAIAWYAERCESVLVSLTDRCEFRRLRDLLQNSIFSAERYCPCAEEF